MATIELNKDNISEYIETDGMLVVNFWGSECEPSQLFSPVFDATSDAYPDITFARVNVDQQPALTRHFQVKATPSTMIMREKVILFLEAAALKQEALSRIIDSAQAIDMADVHAQAALMQAAPATAQ